MTGGGWTRRGVLAATAGAAATAGPVAARQDTDDDFDGWFTADAKGDATDNFDGSVADMTGRAEVTVEVGADGNGGSFAFAPPAVRVDPGTAVTFEWVSDTHNVVVEDRPDGAGWEGVESIENEGFIHEHAFEAEGIYKYFCQPHLSVGMKGAVVVGNVGGTVTGPSVDLTPFERTLLGLGIGAGLLAPIGFAAVDRYLRGRGVELAPAEDAPAAEPAEAIGHDEFTPAGT